MWLLPPELLANVLSHLSLHERVRAGGVCKQWRSVAMARSHWDARMEPVLRSAPPLPDESVSQRLARVARQKRLWDRRERFSHPKEFGKGDWMPEALACTRESVVALCDDGRLRAWHVQTLQLLGESKTKHEGTAFALSEPSPNWRMLASCDKEGDVIVWNAESLRHLQRLQVSDVVSASVNDRVVVAWSLKCVRVVMAATGEVVLELKPRERVLYAHIAVASGVLVVVLANSAEGWRLPSTPSDGTAAVKVFSEYAHPAGGWRADEIAADGWSGSVLFSDCGLIVNGASTRRVIPMNKSEHDALGSAVEGVVMRSVNRIAELWTNYPAELKGISVSGISVSGPGVPSVRDRTRDVLRARYYVTRGGTLAPIVLGVFGVYVRSCTAVSKDSRSLLEGSVAWHEHGDALAAHVPLFFTVSEQGALLRFRTDRPADVSVWRAVPFLKPMIPTRDRLRRALRGDSARAWRSGVLLAITMATWLVRLSGVVQAPFTAMVLPPMLIFAGVSWTALTEKAIAKSQAVLVLVLMLLLLHADGWLPVPSVVPYAVLSLFLLVVTWLLYNTGHGAESRFPVAGFFAIITVAIPVAAALSDAGQLQLYLFVGMGLVLLAHLQLLLFCSIKLVAQRLDKVALLRWLPKWMRQRDVPAQEYASVVVISAATGTSCALGMLAHAGVATGVPTYLAMLPACVSLLALYLLVTLSL